MYSVLYNLSISLPSLILGYSLFHFVPGQYLYITGILSDKPDVYYFASTKNMGDRLDPENDMFWFIPEDAIDIKVVFDSYYDVTIADFRLPEAGDTHLPHKATAITDANTANAVMRDLQKCPWRFELPLNGTVYELVNEHNLGSQSFMIIDKENNIGWYYYVAQDRSEGLKQICNL